MEMEKQIIKKIIEKIKQLVRHKHAALTESGNAAIFAALLFVKKNNPNAVVLIPDHGAWHTYSKYCKKLCLGHIELKTDRGLIIPGELEKMLMQNKINKISAFILASFAGYCAAQPMKEIALICRKYKCMLIEDCSGSIGLADYMPELNLCAGLADISLGSFGKWKAVDLGKCGFIASNILSNKSLAHFEIKEPVLDELDESDLKTILYKLENVSKRFDFLFAETAKVKKELRNSNIIHRDSRGIVVIVGFNTEQEKEKIINYCKKNDYEYAICPKDIRVNENAVSIEIKRKDKG